jgi:hypothetical protein
VTCEISSENQKWGQISEGERPFGRGRFCWNIKKEVKRANVSVNWAERQFQDRILWRAVVNPVKNLWVP